MRITQNIMSQTLLSNLQTNYQKLEQIQEQLSSGKKINKPSDNPVSTVRAMYYQTSLHEIDQYKRNVSDGMSWMQTTDDALDQVTQVLQRVRELTVQAGNSTNNPNDLNAIGSEISQLKEHLGEVANSEIGGRYVFAGTDTKTPPYDTSKKEFTNTNQQPINYQVGKGTSVQINVSGVDVFQYDGGLFNLLETISSSIKAGNNPADQLKNIDDQIDNVLTLRSDLGARMNRMDLSSSLLDGLEQSTDNLMSNEVNVDIAKAYTEFAEQQSVYTAALQVGAKIIQPSLVDFLR